MDDQWVRYTLTAELRSDAHFGSGSGGGGIDGLVARDRYERPVIWASHVEGVLRDAARRLRGNKEAEAFFGRAGGDYVRGDRQRAIFTSLYADDSPESRIWRSTARAAFDNRAPKDDTLRVIEYVPTGTTLTGEVELPAGDVETLKRLLQEVDALGGGRATGAGHVRLSLSRKPASPQASGEATGRLALLLTNRDPLCMTATATPDNLIPSLAFVPGRTLLGAVAAWLIANGERETASLLTSGQVSVSDALPLPQAPDNLATTEVLPAPLSLQSEKPKGTAGHVPWWAQAHAPTPRLDAWNAQAATTAPDRAKLKRPEPDLFVYRTSATDAWKTFRPEQRVRLRNGRPDPRQAEPSLFAIEQIVEETHFLAELHGSPDDMKRIAERLAPVLEGRRWLRVGRGGVPVEVAKLAWLKEERSAKPLRSARLTLTSDLLVRDDLMRWRTALDEATLRDLIGSDELTLCRSLQDSANVNGFNGTSRLWRMPATAIRRGSVFEIAGAGIAKLAQLAASGNWLGERTHEGFGRFRLDETLPGISGKGHAPATRAFVADAADDAIAARTKEWFDAHKGLAKQGGGADRKPSLSQWFGLIADLEREVGNAIDSRLTPDTAGGKSWKHADAKAILEKLDVATLQPSQRAAHARFFVRWLRAEMRSIQRQGA